MSDLKKVKELRKATGAGFKDCNNALKESNGDLQKSIEILRVKGISKASKKMSREANEGLVALSGDEKSTSVIEINCETDFVAKNEDFIKFVKEISEINHKVMSISLNDVFIKYFNSSPIDYMSVDTEGSELLILEQFDFEKFSPKIVTVEHNFTESETKLER